ncbi:MAG TPA: prepilin peptidase [Pirellulales bacterium]|nr:prepilin peptidase [Pirellulales bacterium]
MSLALPFAAVWPAPFEWAMLVGLFVLGASIGSFLNVVVYRLPRGMSLVQPGSRCPTCGVAIAPYDNLPIAGWLLLAGRCRACRQPISWRYPAVELTAAVLFVAVAWCGPLSSGRNLPERVQGSGFRVQQSVDRGLPSLPAGRRAAMSSGELWGVYAYHLCLLCSLLCAALTEFDGQRFSLRLIVPVLLIGFPAPLAWPNLRPISSGLIGAAGHSDWLVALADGAIGLAAGWIFGWAAEGSGFRVQGSGFNSLAGGGRFAAALAWVGVFLGWQAAAALAVATTAAWFCFSLIRSAALPPLRRVGPVLCLAPWTLAWILGWRSIVNHAPWLGPAANGWVFAGALAIVAVLGWLIGKARGDIAAT